MLAADTDVQIRVSGLAKLDSHLHQLADTGLIQFCKRIILVDLSIVVCT